MTQGQRSLLGAGLFLSLALMGGRLAGFGREILLASSLGLSAEADIAIILLTVPDLLVNLLLSGGIGVALIPALKSTTADKAAALFLQASLVVGSIFAAIAVLFVLMPAAWLWLLAPGMLNPLRWLDGWMIYIVAAAIPLTALSGVSSAALNAKDHFFVAGCGTLIFNLSIIGGLVFAMVEGGRYLAWLCVGIICGAIVRWVSQLLALNTKRLTDEQGGAHGWLMDRHLLRGFFAGLASASLLVLVPVILRAGASWLGEGELAAFNYAIKLVELPLGILITTLATVAFPRLSESYDRQDKGVFEALLNTSLQRSLVLSIAVVLCGFPFIDAAIFILFGAGRVGGAGLLHITVLTQIALFSVPWVGVSSLAAAALNAQRQPGLVLRRTVITMLFLPVLCIPGLWLKEPVILMWALPVFHVMFAISLIRAAGLRGLRQCWGMSYAILRSAAAIGAVVLVGVLVDVVFLTPAEPEWVGSLPIWRLGLAGLTFFISVTAGLYIMRPPRNSVA